MITERQIATTETRQNNEREEESNSNRDYKSEQ